MTTWAKVIAVDLSLASTGLATWTPNTVPDVRTVRTRPGVRDEARWEQIAGALFSDVNFAPAVLVVFEGRINVTGRGVGTLDLAELRGVLRYGLYRRSVPYVDIHPSTLKVYATGDGRAHKDDMLLAAERRLGHLAQVKGNDQADALWLLAMALDHYGTALVEMPVKQRKALTKPDWPALDGAS